MGRPWRRTVARPPGLRPEPLRRLGSAQRTTAAEVVRWVEKSPRERPAAARPIGRSGTCGARPLA